jgi:cation:H+ antiporter
VLAAVGTALPETMIPIVAILFGTGAASHAVGVGAILGAPFMLSTLAMFVTGVAVLLAARHREARDVMPVDTGVLAHDMAYFGIAYALAVGAGFLPLEPVWLKWIVAVALLSIYAWYVKGHFEADVEVDAEDLAPLRFRRLDRRAHRRNPQVPRLRVVNLQVLAAIALIIVGAIFFVDAVEHLATTLGIEETLLALVVAPIATELPEKFNSIFWMRDGKDTLALGNITGAMMFQSTIPVAFGVLFTPWNLQLLDLFAVVLALASGGLIFFTLRRSGTLRAGGLMLGGLFYVAFVIGAIIAVT